jgi:hypothetical protein
LALFVERRRVAPKITTMSMSTAPMIHARKGERNDEVLIAKICRPKVERVATARPPMSSCARRNYS